MQVVRVHEKNKRLGGVCGVGGFRTIFTDLAGIDTVPNLLHSLRSPELELLLNDGFTPQSQNWGRGSRRCVPWVTLL